MTTNGEFLQNLLKKWELYWNHYKLQNDALEQRRKFLWIIQAALYYGWYKSLSNNPTISFIICILGIVITIVWVVILKRDSESAFLTEQALRDVESQWNKVYKEIEFNRFTLERDCFVFNKLPYKWKYLDDDEKEFSHDRLKSMWSYDKCTLIKIMYDLIDNFKIKSIRTWLTWILPVIFLMAWGSFLFLSLCRV